MYKLPQLAPCAAHLRDRGFHLAALAHQRIAFITGPAGNADAAERLRGYRDACKTHLVACSSDLEIAGDFSEASGYAAALKILDMKPRPTAMFAANDAMAVGALFALRERDVRVPEDMAIVGFDDIPIARYVTPRLTTVTVAIAELGRRAIEVLLGHARRLVRGRERKFYLPSLFELQKPCPDSRAKAGTERYRRPWNKRMDVQ